MHIRGKLLAGALAIGAMAAAAQAQQAPVDLVTVPAVPTDYVPKTTPWGDPDLRGRWPIDHLNGTPLQRTPEQGNRMFLSDEEMEERRRRIEAAAAAMTTRMLRTGWARATGSRWVSRAAEPR